MSKKFGVRVIYRKIGKYLDTVLCLRLGNSPASVPKH
jgi:hypothetical protein